RGARVLPNRALGDLLHRARQLVVEEEDLAAAAAVAHEVGGGLEPDPARALALGEGIGLLDPERLRRDARVLAARLERNLHEERRRAVSRARIAGDHGDEAERDGLDGCAHGSPRHDLHLPPLPVWLCRSLSRSPIIASRPRICSTSSVRWSRAIRSSALKSGSTSLNSLVAWLSLRFWPLGFLFLAWSMSFWARRRFLRTCFSPCAGVLFFTWSF